MLFISSGVGPGLPLPGSAVMRPMHRAATKRLLILSPSAKVSQYLELCNALLRSEGDDRNERGVIPGSAAVDRPRQRL